MCKAFDILYTGEGLFVGKKELLVVRYGVIIVKVIKAHIYQRAL